MTKLACRLAEYCDAIADIFGVAYDTVYEHVHEAYIGYVSESAR